MPPYKELGLRVRRALTYFLKYIKAYDVAKKKKKKKRIFVAWLQRVELVVVGRISCETV